MAAALLLIGAVLVAVGSFAHSWKAGLVAVGVMALTAGADEARRQ